MAMNALPSSSKRTSTLSRVVPGTSLTIIRSAWASVLTSVLLPDVAAADDRHLHHRLVGVRLVLGGRLGQPLDDRVEQFAALPRFSFVLTRTIFRAQAIELVGLRCPAGVSVLLATNSTGTST